MSNATVSPPAGMVEVTKDEFYRYMGPRDVHPSVRDPNVTSWETRDRTVLGVSYPGWRNPGDPASYWLPEHAVKPKSGC